MQIPLVLKDLDAKGLLYDAPKFEHEYPFCWRCDTPLIYFARSTWFIAMSTMREQLLKSNRMIKWYPESIRDGRMGDFLENVIDWGISRERYWGTPLPVWECECGHRHCIGSIEELKSMSDDCPDDIELHKPYVDNVHIKCPECGGKMTRVSEVIDCWFDSGAMPFAQYHYPFENKEYFESHYPCQFISEALDQTRGWFYSLIAESTVLFGRAPFENCIVMGLVMDEEGIKMSKHKGNVVDPWDVLNLEGADAARWYFYSTSAPWLPNRFSHESVKLGQSKFIGTYWNTYAFYIMYADIDNFDPTKYELDTKNLCAMDRWILSRLNSLIKEVDSKLQAYDITTAARMIQDFTDELSNWYVRRGRERYWAGDMNKDKVDAFMTLYTVLEQFTRLSAPFVPFVTESVYQNLVRSVDANAPESVHMCSYPVADESLIDRELETEMDLVRNIVELGRAARNAANIKNRQPVSDIFVVSDTKLDEEYQGIVLDELNIKSIKMLDDASSLTDYKFKPQLRTCGRKFGPKLNAAKEVIAALPGKETMAALKAGPVKITVEGEEFEMNEEDFLVEMVQPEGLSTKSDKGITVSLNTVLTEDLIEEGLVREMISKIQNQRKETEGLQVTDRISVKYCGNDKLASIIEKNKETISSEVLAVTIEAGNGNEAELREWNVNGESISIAVRRLEQMLIELIRNAGRYSIQEIILLVIVMLFALTISFSFHEFMHAWVADRLGDSTPRMYGRVTLNPMAHLDPMGTLLLLLVGFGWGKPVVYNPSRLKRFKSKRLMNIMVTLAGVTGNFIIALVSMCIISLIMLPTGFPTTVPDSSAICLYRCRYGTGQEFLSMQPIFCYLFYYTFMFSMSLMAFNLLPYTASGRISFLRASSPVKVTYSEWFLKFAQYGPMVLMILIILGNFGRYRCSRYYHGIHLRCLQFLSLSIASLSDTWGEHERSDGSPEYPHKGV